MRCILVAIGLLILFTAAPLFAADRVDYVREIKPLLAKNCFACHSPLRQRSGFRMDTADLLIQGGEVGRAVIPGKSSESLLIHAVTGTEGMSIMPPDGNGERLSEADVNLLRRWIDEGAKAPAETPASNPHDHWSFQPVSRPDVPKSSGSTGATNPIDAFVEAEYARLGLKPQPLADRHVLLRRVYLDLTGLPPTRDELRSFLADESPEAYKKVVDQLLASPRYGERWGRHWMDVWRYSDWAGWGQQVRDSQPHIWHWRDWIIESLNNDRPYDEMVVAMLAGDELSPNDPNALRATGYLARNFKLLSREQWLQDTVEHTAKAFLGLTMNCCRCHDHMTDPIDQQEYYQFRAIFEPHNVRLDRIPGVADTATDGLPRVFDKDLATPTYLFVRGDERQPQKDKPLLPGVPAILQRESLRDKFSVGEISLPREAFDPFRREFVTRDDVAASEKSVATSRQKLDELKMKMPVDEAAVAKAELETAVSAAKHEALIATVEIERIEQSGDTKSDAWTAAAKAATSAQRHLALVEARRDLNAAQTEQRKVAIEVEMAKKAAGENEKEPKLVAATTKLTAADKKVTDVEAKLKQAETTVQAEPTVAYTKRTVTTFPATSTGRRLALARWIANSKNPLTARVAVNHLWSRHFDAAIVPTVFNFGLSGTAPINRPLLDWLAAELMEPKIEDGPVRPWAMKHIHKLIVTSRTYQLASTTAVANVKIDPDNRYLWRAPTRRMEAEVVRDSTLYVAGQLDGTMFGADLDHMQGLTIKRRSLYFRNAAEKQMLFLKLFDCANVGECYERRGSVVPQQALALANSELTLSQARLLARRLHAENPSDAKAFLTAAIEQVLARPATDAELKLCLEHLSQQETYFTQNAKLLSGAAASLQDSTKPSADPVLRARENLVLALLNHNDFVTVR